MASHRKRHGITSAADHIAGTPANPGEFNAFGTNEDGILSELVVEAVQPAQLRTGAIVRRSVDAQIVLPTTHASGNQAVSYNQVSTMVGQGPYRGFVEGAVEDHTSADVGAPPAEGLKVADRLINLTDLHIYTVLSIANGNTGNLVEWDEGELPTEEVYYFNMATGSQIAFRPEKGEWIDMGSSTHSRAHDIESSADHFTRTNRTGIVYTNNKLVNVLAMVDQETGVPSVPIGSILISSGYGTPEFSSIKVARAFTTGPADEPTIGDVANWAAGTFGYITTPSGFFHAVKISSTVLKSVELT